jgi:hypothetical protein
MCSSVYPHPFDSQVGSVVLCSVWDVLFHAVVFFISNRLQPNSFSFLSRRNRYIGKAAIGRCPVPMLHAWSALDYIALVNDLHGLASLLIKASALGDEQNLTPWMHVPIQLCTGIISCDGDTGVEGTVSYT